MGLVKVATAGSPNKTRATTQVGPNGYGLRTHAICTVCDQRVHNRLSLLNTSAATDTKQHIDKEYVRRWGPPGVFGESKSCYGFRVEGLGEVPVRAAVQQPALKPNKANPLFLNND